MRRDPLKPYHHPSFLSSSGWRRAGLARQSKAKSEKGSRLASRDAVLLLHSPPSFIFCRICVRDPPTRKGEVEGGIDIETTPQQATLPYRTCSGGGGVMENRSHRDDYRGRVVVLFRECVPVPRTTRHDHDHAPYHNRQIQITNTLWIDGGLFCSFGFEFESSSVGERKRAVCSVLTHWHRTCRSIQIQIQDNEKSPRHLPPSSRVAPAALRVREQKRECRCRPRGKK
ncbi:hypothetical protein BC827DRAFT_629663 [Russula dissimulans]|nr:hypothetical protein BC827DRAFT_629663 [Russula dissimulans]